LILCLLVACARKAPPPGKADLESPHLQVLHPLPGDTLSDSVRIQVQVTDRSTVPFVRLFVDGQPVAADSTEPYEPLWDTSELVDTFHTLYLQATDRWDNVGKSEPVTVFTRNGNEPERQNGELTPETEPSDEKPEAE
jgi:hypothetical protein